MKAAPLVARPVPPDTLLDRYRQHGGYVDCFETRVPGAVPLGDFVAACYNGRAFRPERWAIGLLLRRPAGPREVAALAGGRSDRFSAWRVEARTACEVLLCDYQGRTRSWLMVQREGRGTVLRFGTTVLPQGSRGGALAVRLLAGLHRCYARLLLRSAVVALRRREAWRTDYCQ